MRTRDQKMMDHYAKQEEERTEDQKNMGQHRGESEWSSTQKKEHVEGWKRWLREEKKKSERGTSMHMKEHFFWRLAATQYFNMLLDPNKPGLEVCVYVSVCERESDRDRAQCSSLSCGDKLLSTLFLTHSSLCVQFYNLQQETLFKVEAEYFNVCRSHGQRCSSKLGRWLISNQTLFQGRFEECTLTFFPFVFFSPRPRQSQQLCLRKTHP